MSSIKDCVLDGTTVTQPPVCRFYIGKSKIPVRDQFHQRTVKPVRDFEQERLVYRETLKGLVKNVMDPKTGFFKIQKELMEDPELLVEIMHTILISCGGDLTRFYEYFKFKKKEAGTDYRVTIKKLILCEKQANEALSMLLSSKEFFKEDMGRERIMVFQFTHLSPEEYNIMSHLACKSFHCEESPVVRHINVVHKSCLIVFLRNYNTKMLDLHGFEKKLAQENISSYVRGMYFLFQNKAALMTGRGIHSKAGPSSLTPLKRASIESLGYLNEVGGVSIKSSVIMPDQVIAKFPAPTIVSEKDLPGAILEKKNRIIVKLDKQLSPGELEMRAIRLMITMVMLDPTKMLEANLVPQSKHACDYVRLHFSYPQVEPLKTKVGASDTKSPLGKKSQ